MGNPTNYKGVALTWEGRKLASYGNYFFFEYDENGLRTSKTFGSSYTEYYYNGSLLMGLKSGLNTLLFSYDASGSVISVNHNGTEYYYLKNAQSDIVGIVDASGTVVANYAYDSWGKVVFCFSPTSNAICTLSPFRYRGYVYDVETGLYYLQSRYYDPSVGRFISADDIALLGANGDFASYNLFAYCGNNPVARFDSIGCLWEVIVGAAIGGAIAGAIIGAVSYVVSSGINDAEVTCNGLIDAIATGAATGAIGAIGGALGGATAVIGSICVGVISGVKTASKTDGDVFEKSVAGTAAFVISGLGTFAGTIIPIAKDGAFASGFSSYVVGLFSGTVTEISNVFAQEVISRSFNKKQTSDFNNGASMLQQANYVIQ